MQTIKRTITNVIVRNSLIRPSHKTIFNRFVRQSETWHHLTAQVAFFIDRNPTVASVETTLHYYLRINYKKITKQHELLLQKDF